MRKFNLTALALLLGVSFLVPPLPAWSQSAGGSGGAAAAVAPAAGAAASPTFAAARSSAERITADKLKEILYFIASDEMAGRDTPSEGLDATAKYIADRLKKLKLKPAGDKGSYFQRIKLRRTQVDLENTSAQLGDRKFRVGEGFLPTGRVSGEAEGQLVYAGHGWVIRSKGVNAYEGIDVKDKIVVVAGNGTAPPPGVTNADIKALPGGDWETPVSYAQKHGAKGLVLIPRNFERMWRYGPRLLGRASYSVPRLTGGSASEEDEDDEDKPEPPGVVSIIPSREMLAALFAGERAEGAGIIQAALGAGGAEPLKSFALSPEKRLRMSVRLTAEDASTQNVVGIVEGRDSVLKKEYVALGAHYDHVGTAARGYGCRPVGSDSICNGADDDGSGTTALLAMAEAFSKGKRPRRSVLFVWHAGEEHGLWGSEYFTEFPTVPLENVVAQLNIDMIGRSKRPGDTNPRNRMLSGPDEIYVIGSRMMSTELAELSESVNRSLLGLKFNYHYDEPGDPERLFYRSDHFNYAKKGIPIIFYFDGIHEDYHQPTDSADKIDYEKLEKVTRTVFVTASELANAPRRPAIDKRLPPERMTR